MSEPTGRPAASARTVLREPRADDLPLFLTEQERAQLAYLESIDATEDAELFRRIVAGAQPDGEPPTCERAARCMSARTRVDGRR